MAVFVVQPIMNINNANYLKKKKQTNIDTY